MEVLGEIATVAESGSFFGVSLGSGEIEAGTVIFCYNLFGLYDKIIKPSPMYICLSKTKNVKSFPRVRPREFLKGSWRTVNTAKCTWEPMIKLNQRGSQVTDGWRQSLDQVSALQSLAVCRLKFTIWLVNECNSLSLKDVALSN